jgi:hypothetical protein
MRHPFAGLVDNSRPITTPTTTTGLNDLELESVAAGMDKQGQGDGNQPPSKKYREDGGPSTRAAGEEGGKRR